MTPTTALDVSGSRGTIRIAAIIDTGFDGDVCLPKTAAIRLGLELSGFVEMELADGTAKRELLFSGTVRFLEEIRNVYIILTDSEDALIGTRLLSDCRLMIDFPTNSVQLTRKSRGRRRR